jgi:hypothetical protein
MGWFFLGLLLGVGIGWNRKVESIPKDLEKCTVERSQQEQDIAYYKKLTRTLVDENKELRNKINDA